MKSTEPDPARAAYKTTRVLGLTWHGWVLALFVGMVLWFGAAIYSVVRFGQGLSQEMQGMIGKTMNAPAGSVVLWNDTAIAAITLIAGIRKPLFGPDSLMGYVAHVSPELQARVVLPVNVTGVIEPVHDWGKSVRIHLVAGTVQDTVGRHGGLLLHPWERNVPIYEVRSHDAGFRIR